MYIRRRFVPSYSTQKVRLYLEALCVNLNMYTYFHLRDQQNSIDQHRKRVYAVRDSNMNNSQPLLMTNEEKI